MATFKFHKDHTIPTGEWIWVFGSNENGIHGKGAAKVARVNFRALHGQCSGPTGQAYAIATKDRRLLSRPLPAIAQSIEQFIDHAIAHPRLNFFVTRVGCELAGYSDQQIAPMFARAPGNCSLPEPWRAIHLRPAGVPA